MGRRLPHTPSSIIRNALRRLSLRCRERVTALKRDEYTCQVCGRKQSRAKGRECRVEAHHARRRPDWARIEAVIRDELLQTADDWVCLCADCHKEAHYSPKVARSNLHP
jgi:predicted HNH restriction endonuclease